MVRHRHCWLYPIVLLAVGIWPLWSTHTDACASQGAGELDQVILVFKTHFDIGYTDLASNVIDHYRTAMIDQALEVCDRNRELPPEQQFVWTLPGWPLSQIAADWSGQTATRKARIDRAIREGRFVVHGLPFTTHTELLEPEDLVRGLGFSSAIARAAGIGLPRDAKMTDVPCHSWIMPTLLRQAGIDFLHLGCNAASQSPHVPLLFWWEGPDGSRVLTMYVAEGYGTGLLPPDDWPHRTWLALIHTGDNHGPPRPEEVSRLVDELRAKRPQARVRIGRLSDFADAILAERPDLPVVRGDMPDTWIHGPMCDPRGASLARTVRPRIAATESLNTLLRLWGVPVADAAPTIRAAYEQSLLYGEHTWGGALYWVTPYDSPTRMVYGDQWQRQRAEGRFTRLESSWDEHTAYIESARDLIMPQLDQQLQALVQSVNVGGQRVTVYNPLPWPRDGYVTAAWTGSPPQALRCADSRTIVPVKVTEAGIQFVARQLPGMGYRTFVAADPVPTNDELTWDSDSCSLSGPHFHLGIDPVRGAVSSLVDKRTGRDWIDAAAPYALGQYVYERFDRDQVAAFVDAYVKIDTAWAINELGKPNLPPSDEVRYRRVSPENFDVRVEHSPVAISAVMQSASGGRLPHGVTARVTLYRDLPCVDVEVTVHDKPADPWPEAGWLCLPIHAPGARFRLGRLGSIVDPVHDLVPGSNHRLLALNTGMAVVDSSGAGLGMCPLDSPLVSFDEPGCWKYDPVYVPSGSHVYVNLFNNQWTTNFRLWNEGTWTSRVRLWALDSERIDQSLVVGALEARYPLCAAVTDGPGGPLPTMRQGVRVSCPGVLVTALGTNPDGDGTLLRLWDHTGRPGECAIDVPAALAARTARHVDLRGSRLDLPVSRASDALSVTINPMAPASLVFESAGNILP